MRVVSNTSPLSNLAIIGQLALVREQLGNLLIPPAVHAELLRNPHPNACATLQGALQEGWIRVMPLAGVVPTIFTARLDLGEAEALALALETKASLVLLDDCRPDSSVLTSPACSVCSGAPSRPATFLPSSTK
jgi:predicted nucleic acid-binding protein